MPFINPIIHLNSSLGILLAILQAIQSLKKTDLFPLSPSKLRKGLLVLGGTLPCSLLTFNLKKQTSKEMKKQALSLKPRESQLIGGCFDDISF
jgi:hypothetical protein